MSRLIAAITVLFALGCGPMQVPMANRLDDDQQREIDAAWNRASSPVTKLDRQNWLDLFVAAQAYQLGVDTLYFRSEKSIANGRVVMEVRYDRSVPDEDIFQVQFFDDKNAQIREERYTRQDVEDTYNFFFSNVRPDDEAELKQFENQLESRWKAIAEYFPEGKKEAESSPGGEME